MFTTQTDTLMTDMPGYGARYYNPFIGRRVAHAFRCVWQLKRSSISHSHKRVTQSFHCPTQANIGLKWATGHNSEGAELQVPPLRAPKPGALRSE